MAHAHSLLDSLLGGFVKDAPLYALDCRVSAYLWQEEEGGLQKKGCDHGGMAKVLRLKAKGCTPNVYRCVLFVLCSVQVCMCVCVWLIGKEDTCMKPSLMVWLH